MNSALKTCVVTERLLVLISGVLLAFTLSQSGAPYQSALNDLLAIGEDGAADLTHFMTSKWLVKRRVEDQVLPIYQASNETLRTFATVLSGTMDSLGAGINDDVVFTNTIFTDLRDEVRLKGWERPDLFLPLPPVERPTVRRMLDYLARHGLSGTILVLPSYQQWLTPHVQKVLRERQISVADMTLVEVDLLSESLGKGRIETILKEPGRETPSGLFRFTFQDESASGDRPIQLDVEVPMNRTGFSIGSAEWIDLKRGWYRSNGVDPDPYVSPTAPFKNLRVLDDDIGHMTLGDAADWLRKKAADDGDYVMLGVTLQNRLFPMIGPLVLSILMIGIISAIHHILSFGPTVQLTNGAHVFWGAVSPSRIAKAASLAAISLVPGATCVVIGVRLDGDLTTLSLNACGALIALLVFWRACKLISATTVSESDA